MTYQEQLDLLTQATSKKILLDQLTMMDNPTVIKAYIESEQLSINDMLSNPISPEVGERLAEHIREHGITEQDVQELRQNSNVKFCIEQMHEGATESALQEMEDANINKVIDALVDSPDIQRAFALNGDRKINNDPEIQSIKQEASVMKDNAIVSKDELDKMQKELDKCRQQLADFQYRKSFLSNIKAKALTVINNCTNVIMNLGKSMSKSTANHIMEVTRPISKYVTEATKEAKLQHEEIMKEYKDISNQIKDKTTTYIWETKDNITNKATNIKDSVLEKANDVKNTISKAIDLNPFSKFQRLQSEKDLNQVIININNNYIAQTQAKIEHMILKQEKTANRPIEFQNVLRRKLGMPEIDRRDYETSIKAASLMTKLKLKSLQIKILREQKEVLKLTQRNNEISKQQNDLIKDKAWNKDQDVISTQDNKWYLSGSIDKSLDLITRNTDDEKLWETFKDNLSTQEKLALLTAANCGMKLDKVFEVYAKSDQSLTEIVSAFVDKHLNFEANNIQKSNDNIDKSMQAIANAEVNEISAINQQVVDNKIDKTISDLIQSQAIYREQSPLQQAAAKFAGKTMGVAKEMMDRASEDMVR